MEKIGGNLVPVVSVRIWQQVVAGRQFVTDEFLELFPGHQINRRLGGREKRRGAVCVNATAQVVGLLVLATDFVACAQLAHRLECGVRS